MPTSERWRVRLAERVVRNGRWYAEGANQHGKPATYTNWGCRCDPCTDAHRDYMQSQREARMQQRELVDGRMVSTGAPRHGTASTYVNWACRCEDCGTAYRLSLRAKKD